MSHSGMSADAMVEREVDLLIAGAGPAGMAAALVASLEGLDVILCEKIGSGWWHRIDLSGHPLDSGQQSEPRRRLQRQWRTSRPLSERTDWRGEQTRPQKRLSTDRPECD